MKRLTSLLLLLLVCCVSLWAQSEKPEFSTSASPKYYKMKFKSSSLYIADKGANALYDLASVAPFAETDAHLFAFVGTEASFTILSKSGQYVGVRDGKLAGVPEASATRFKLNPATTGYFTISRTSDGTTSFNPWQGAVAGHNIGFWENSDANNPLFFEAPYFSTEAAPIYWDLKFNASGRYLADKGGDALIATTNSGGEDANKFALVGTKSSFRLLTKGGRYVGVKRAQATNNQTDNLLYATTSANAVDFTIVNANANGTFEIARTSATGTTFNPWGGTSVTSNNIGFWTANDGSNKLRLMVPVEPAEFAAATITGAATFEKPSTHTLWYNRPATVTGVANPWMEYSLPIGNGRLGACLFGGVRTDEIQFNEKTLWSGGPNNMGSDYGYYLNNGSVKVQNLSPKGANGTSATTDYVRYLDIENAVAGVNFTDADGTKITRRYIASQPAGVIAVRYKAEGANKLNLCFFVEPGEQLNNTAPVYADGMGSFGGKLTTVHHYAAFKVVPVGGTMTATEKGIEVKDATEVLLILGSSTSFDSKVAARTSGTLQDVTNRVNAAVNAAAARTWDDLLAEHKTEFTGFMSRVNLKIRQAASDKNTEDLIKFYNTSEANKSSNDGLFLEQLYFNYGRYLSISSSRGDLNVPNNLQGIWNDKANAPWHSDIHTNINIQMNYWPTEPTNLSECHLPLLNYIIDNAASANWQAAAKRAGANMPGWTVFTESNIFGGMSTWGSNYFVANAWYVAHLWQHYRYTLDQDFLKRAFPAMWTSAQFWMARMIKDRRVNDNTYVCPDEYSPEQNDHPTEDATAHAQQLVMSNLQSCKDAIGVLGAAALGLSDADVQKLDEYLRTTDTGLHTETYAGDWGTWATNNGIKTGDLLLKEWKYTPYSVSTDKGHRHMSHLMCLYPLNQVQEGDEYFQSAVNALKLRGDEATGWSMGWKVNLWARAKDGDHARIIIKNALKHSTAYNTNQYAGGIYYNLFDSHAPFQIDGNFGVCAGIAELLLQSQHDIIEILPALPSVWREGSITGLKAVGNFTVDIDWAGGKATKVRIESHKGAPLRVKGANLDKVEILVGGQPAEVVKETGDVYLIKGVAEGATVTIDYTKSLLVDNDYPISFDKKANATGTDRYVSAYTFKTEGAADQQLTLSADHKPYQDFTEQAIEVKAGATLNILPTWTGGTEMHTYAYLDLDQNFLFDVADATSPELVAFNYANGKSKKSGVLADDNSAASGSVASIPPFAAPAEPGLYRLRLKIDWDDIAPAGSTKAGNEILKNRGSIVDIMLRVVNAQGNALLNISPADYATFYAEKPYIMPAGVEGGVVTVENGKAQVRYPYTSGSIVPARTPLLLKGTTGTYAIEWTDAASTVEAGTNLLLGTLSSALHVASGTTKHYIFADDAQGRGFYFQGTTNDGSVVKRIPGKAYLALPNAPAGVRGFALNDIVTGMDAAPVAPATGAIYDLSGRRVAQPERGIYLRNGRKILK